MDAAHAAARQSVTDQQTSPKRPPWSPGGSLRILIVDSEWTPAEQLAGALLIKGHQVRCARRGAEALVVAEELEPHLVLIELGGSTGRGCPTSVLLRCRPWAEDLVLVGYSRHSDARRRHCELLHYEFPGAIDLEQLIPIFENVLRMREALCAASLGASPETAKS